jgi:hypothetical protein
MLGIHRILFPCLAIVGGLAAPVHPARGASIGAKGHHDHPDLQAQDVILPPLHEHVPTNVPSLSNQSLIKLWERNQFSPILRNSSIQMQLCAAVTAQHDLNPAKYDRLHPIVGRLIDNPNYFNKLLAAYLAHPARFTLNHHRLVPLIRGCALMMNQPPVTSPSSPGTSEVGGISVSGNTSPPTPPPDSGAQVLSVPGPPSLVLMVLGMSYVASRIRGRRSPAAA